MESYISSIYDILYTTVVRYAAAGAGRRAGRPSALGTYVQISN